MKLVEEDGVTSRRGKKWRMSKEGDNVNKMSCIEMITRVEGDLMYRWEIGYKMM